MGSFPGTCCFSGLSIQEGQDAVLFFLQHQPELEPGAFYAWRPCSPPVFCHYRACGDYRPHDPLWYCKTMFASLGCTGRSKSTTQWQELLDNQNIRHCAIRRDVFDPMVASLNPSWERQADALATWLTRQYPKWKAQKKRDDYKELVTGLLFFLMETDAEVRENKTLNSSLHYSLAHGREGAMTNSFWLRHWVEPRVKNSQLQEVMRRLAMGTEIDTLMYLAQRPWAPACSTAPQDGNGDILAPIFRGLAKLAKHG